MQDTIDRFVQDHKRMRAVLTRLTATATRAAEGEPQAEDLLFCMVDYLGEYPHRVHHPCEDTIFKALLEKSVDEAQRDIVQTNADQHRQLEDETQAIQSQFDQPAVDYDELIPLLELYVLHQQTHMRHEEAHVFPLARALLGASDWRRLEEEIADLHDPAFDQAVSRYAALYQCLDAEVHDHLYGPGVSATARFLAATG